MPLNGLENIIPDRVRMPSTTLNSQHFGSVLIFAALSASLVKRLLHHCRVFRNHCRVAGCCTRTTTAVVWAGRRYPKTTTHGGLAA